MPVLHQPEQGVPHLRVGLLDLVEEHDRHVAVSYTHLDVYKRQVLVRGVRNAGDWQTEQAMAEVNRSHGLDTLLLPSASSHIHISSRLIRQVLDAGLPLTGLVSPTVASALAQR